MRNNTLQLETSLPSEDPRDRMIADLELQLRQVRRELADAELEATRAREDAQRALSRLRTQLNPLYRALQAVFGELDAAGVSESTPTPNSRDESTIPDRVISVWEAWKQKLPPACGKIIDALLTHKDLGRQQIKIAARMGESTMDAAIGRLTKAGLLNKASGRYSLKQL